MIVRWLLLFVITAGLYATDINTTNPSEAAPIESAEEIEHQTLYTFYQVTPKQLYINQIFAIKLKALVGSPSFEELTSSISGYEGIKVVGKELTWVAEDPQTYSLTIFLKATAPQIRTPDIDTVLITESNTTATHRLSGIEMTTLTPLAPKPTFSRVIAKNISVIGYKIDHYDPSNNIVLLEIEGRMANLEDFRLPGIAKQGLDSIKQSLPTTRIFYYAIIPANQTKIEFEYLNSETESYATISINLDLSKLEDTRVSTQTEINPKNSSYLVFQVLFLFIVIVAFSILYYHKRKELYLLPVAIALILIVLLLLPEKEIRIGPGTKVYILPTSTSTIFYTSVGEITVKKLKEGEGYTKILFEDGKVGWVRNEDIR
ncbi:MAG: hypothetical protein K6347_03045 [Campylobacterales bacterium]